MIIELSGDKCPECGKGFGDVGFVCYHVYGKYRVYYSLETGDRTAVYIINLRLILDPPALFVMSGVKLTEDRIDKLLLLK